MTTLFDGSCFNPEPTTQQRLLEHIEATPRRKFKLASESGCPSVYMVRSGAN